MDNKIFKYNDKIYKTEAAAKKAQTMDKKRNIKIIKQEQYSLSDKKIKREATIDYKKNYKTKLENAIEANKKYSENKILKTFHIVAKIEQSIIFKDKYNNKSKSYKNSELKHTHLREKTQLIRESEVIKARSYDAAKQIFNENVHRKFDQNLREEEEQAILRKEHNEAGGVGTNGSPEYYETKVESIDFLDEVEISSLSDATQSTMFLKSSSHIDYNFTTEEKQFLKHNDFCVEDNLISIYGQLIKKFTLKNIVDIATVFYKKLNIIWDRTMGYSTDCIMHICQYFHISAYAFDIMGCCFKKNIETIRHYPALFFYAMNNHMYLVKDTNLCKSLTERAKDNNVSFKTSLINEPETKNIYDGYDSSIFIYSRESFTNINDIFEICLGEFGIPSSKSIKASKSNIIRFEYKFDKKRYIIIQDPNDISIINWKKVQSLCIKHEIPFKNQTFLNFIKEKRSEIIKLKSERHTFSDEERRNIYDNSNKLCAICNEKLQRKYELDHIKALASGGTNNIKNIQLLCKSCHKEKSLREKEDGSYIRIIETESTFNNQLLEVMSSELCQRYAFIEHRVPLEQENNNIEIKKDDDNDDNDDSNNYISRLSKYDYVYNDKPNDIIISPTREFNGEYFINNIAVTYYEYNQYLKNGIKKYDYDRVYNNLYDNDINIKKEEVKIVLNIYNIDIKKCRKNNLYYSNYDLPVFTVMDKIQIFNKDESLNTGIYYIETKKYFPLRGNGWYSLPMIEYCLNNKIIKLDDIKYCVQCLVTIPSYYYNEFIDYCYDNLDDDYKKLSINMMIGGFKPNLNKNISWSSVCVTSSTCEAYHQYITNKACFIEIIHVNNIKYFHVYKELERSNMESEKPIYDQIMDLEAIELHKLSKLIESKKGNILDLNTDCVTCSFQNNFHLN